MNLRASFAHFAAFPGVLLALAAVAPAHALTYAETTVTCPLDGKEFQYQAVASYSRFGMQLDLKPLGALVAPIPLPVCPRSGFVMYRDDFTGADIAFFKKLVATPEYRELRRAHSDYFVAAHQAGKRGEDAFDVAYLTLQASWEVDEEPARYEKYARAALARFQDYDASRAALRASQEWWTAKLLIVNLHRRLAEFDRAADLLAELPLQTEPEDSGYRVVAERLSRLISERKSKPAEIAPRQP